tara:strand:+ start:290 stop:847 length:558 start_codon:yes stop_codon:yes gene_type:complete
MLKVANSVINASQIATPITLPGNVTLSTGNLVIGTAGKGIDFSATTSGSGTMTSELLTDYEEGTFTPTLNQGFNGPVGYTSQVGKYTKVGDLVYFHIYIYLAAAQTRNADALGIAGFPFASASGVINGCVWGYAAGVVVAGTALPVFYFGGVAGTFYNTGGAAFTGLTLTSAQPEIAISGVYKTT